MPKNRNLLSHPAINISSQNSPQIGSNFIELQSVDSTNNYAMALVHAGTAKHGTVYIAHEQTAGKGQRGKTWISTPGDNIMMSAIIEPAFLLTSQQFFLSAAIAVSCRDFLSSIFSDDWRIKWPNDLYWRDRKAGGILIENTFKGNKWPFAIVGIGINVNQLQFPEHLQNAVSLIQISGRTFSTVDLAKQLCSEIEKKYAALKEGKAEQIISEYNRVLYKRNEKVRLKRGNITFETTIQEVTRHGQLVTNDATGRSFDFGDVEWLISE